MVLTVQALDKFIVICYTILSIKNKVKFIFNCSNSSLTRQKPAGQPVVICACHKVNSINTLIGKQNISLSAFRHAGQVERISKMANLVKVVREFLQRKAGFDELRKALRELEGTESYVMAFAKRFTSPIVGWPFPMHTVAYESTPGRVGGVRGWTRLEMDLERATALLRFASTRAEYCRVELIGGKPDVPDVIGREASDMAAAKGFQTPPPGMPEGDVPIITIEDVVNWLDGIFTFHRSEVELLVDLGFVEPEQVVVNGHDLLRVVIKGQTFLLPDPDKPSPATIRATSYLWRWFGGKDKHTSRLWPKDAMEKGVTEGESVIRFFSRDKNNKYRLIPTEFPGISVVEVFEPGWLEKGGRYKWFTKEKNFVAFGHGDVTREFDAYKKNGESIGLICYTGDDLPGEKFPEGWEFARRLYRALFEASFKEFDVESPRLRQGEKKDNVPFVRLCLKKNPLKEKFWENFQFPFGEIPQEKWTDSTIEQIVKFVQMN